MIPADRLFAEEDEEAAREKTPVAPEPAEDQTVRLDDVAATNDFETSCIVNPYCPARSRSIFTSTVG